MLDNLRDSASQSPLFQEEPTPAQPPDHGRKRQPDGRFMGMSPAQRFVVALIIFMMVCVLGTVFLLATQKIAPAIF